MQKDYKNQGFLLQNNLIAKQHIRLPKTILLVKLYYCQVAPGVYSRNCLCGTRERFHILLYHYAS